MIIASVTVNISMRDIIHTDEAPRPFYVSALRKGGQYLAGTYLLGVSCCRSYTHRPTYLPWQTKTLLFIECSTLTL